MTDSQRLVATPAVPAHVLPHLIFDYDYVDDARLKPDPFVGVASLREDAPPIFYTPRNGGHWVVTTHRAAFDIGRNSDLFGNKSPGATFIPATIDPPHHKPYRAVLNKAFAPEKVKALSVQVRRIAIDLIDAIAPQKTCEFIGAVAEPLPIIVFMKLVGIPDHYFRDLRNWVVDLLNEADHNKRDESVSRILKVTEELIHARQQKPEDDLISSLVHTELDGRPLTFEELQSYCLMLVVAGLDTVVNSIGFTVRHLAMDQAMQQAMRDDPTRIPTLTEDLLRRYSTVSANRMVRQDAEYEGIQFRTGDRILMHYPVIGIDPDAYPEPEKIIEGRKEPSLAFGIGRHRCVGSHLARMELVVFLEEWLARIPRFRLDPKNPPHLHAGHVFGVEKMDLLWGAP